MAESQSTRALALARRKALSSAGKGAATGSSPELAIAMETWKEIKFEFETVDKLDVA